MKLKFVNELYCPKCNTAFQIPAPPVPDGIYLVYEGGGHRVFTGNNPVCEAEGVKYIGVAHDGHSFCIALKSLGRGPLIKDRTKCPDTHILYVKDEIEAYFNWDYVKQTKLIQELGTEVPLPDDEYIPSVPMLLLMAYLKERINKALAFVGGEPLEDVLYWSSLLMGFCTAWYVSLEIGGVCFDYNDQKEYAVRTVTAFNY